MTPQARRELDDLLEALCEERLTPEQHVRLDWLVVSNREARRLYVDYVVLHGQLAWDVAAAASGKIPTLPDVAAAAEPQPRRSRRNIRRRTLVVGAVAAASIAVVLALNGLWPRPGDGGPAESIAVAPSDPAGEPIVPPVEIDEPPLLRTVERTPPSDTPSVAAPEADQFAPLDVPLTPDPVTAINVAIAQGWEDAGIEPSAVADDAEFVRRVYLDLAGRIPSAAEAEQFFTNASAGKRAELVDALLESPETARNLATGWTNLLVGRAANPELDRAGLHRFLQEQFAANRPWSETVTALITAQGAARENGPANFLLAHLNNEAVPATAVTARCFLGLQVQCTQCHAHPFYKDWGQEQFWELNSFFQQTQVERTAPADGGPPTLALTDRDVGGPTFYENRNGEMKVAFPRFADEEIDPGTATNRRQELARLLLAGDRPQLARAFVNRVWAHFFKHGFTNPVDDMGPHNSPTHPVLLDQLAAEFSDGGYDVRALCRAICNSAPYQLTSRPGDDNQSDDPDQGDPPLFSRMYLKPLTAEQLYDSLQVATLLAASPGAAIAHADVQRQAWTGQFFAAEQTEENCESTTFDGTLPQALTMMNGELVAQAVGSSSDTRLSSILAGTPDESERIRQITLATLSRYPSRDELAAIREFLRRSVRQQVQTGRVPSARAGVDESLRDLYWAYLNSAEFIVNH